MSDIHTAHDTHREDLLQEGLTVLGRWTAPPSPRATPPWTKSWPT